MPSKQVPARNILPFHQVQLPKQDIPLVQLDHNICGLIWGKHLSIYTLMMITKYVLIIMTSSTQSTTKLEFKISNICRLLCLHYIFFCMCAFRSDHLALNNQLMCSSMKKANSSTLSFLQVPIFLWMADPVVFCITFAYTWVLSVFCLHLDNPISEAFGYNSDITRVQNLT